MLSLAGRPDPLGVLGSTLLVMQQARSVTVDLDAVERLAGDLALREVPAVEWDTDLHWTSDPDMTANYVLVLDALNFCFWGDPRWIVTYQGRRYNGYYALAAALKRALEQGIPLTDAAYLSKIDQSDLAAILAGENEIPLLPQRVDNLRQVGRLLLDRYDGTFATMIAGSQRSAITLVRRVVTELSSFNDVASYRGHEIRFYKRAQILAADLAGAFHHDGPGCFEDLHQLTAFADYKVPQVLQHLGLLLYDASLRHRLAYREEISPAHSLEVEIRAGTIWAVEALRRALLARGRSLAPYQLDWMLWEFGQDLPPGVLPYHRTRTIYY